MRTVLITGASSGLGFATAKYLAQYPDLHIVIASRNVDSAAATLREKSEHITAIALDLSSLDDVKRFVEDFNKADLPPLHAIVANAAVNTTQQGQKSADGFELAFAVNYLGHFSLVNQLLAHNPERVVIVNSRVHISEDPAVQLLGVTHPVYTAPEDLAHPKKEHRAIHRYSASKACQMLFGYELARRYPDLSVTMLNPGYMLTNLSQDFPRWYQMGMTVLSRLTGEMRDVEVSAAHLSRLILEDNLENGYYDGDKLIPSSKLSTDAEKAAELWAASAAWTGFGGA